MKTDEVLLEEGNWIPIAKVEEILGFTSGTVYGLVQRGLLRAMVNTYEKKDEKTGNPKVYTVYRFRENWVREYMDRHTTRTIYDKEEPK